ncbi:MAG: hypothetical protein Q8P30_00650 [Candidatus Uhrbacteria bacterium]|nr:hypothetical protein [Candidatus Uhrbacteria bacterium]
MPKHDEAWHLEDIKDEMSELKEARGFFNRWSELSDVVYTVSRAHWSGHKSIKWKMGAGKYLWGMLYMFPKYTLRWIFFLLAGKLTKKNTKLREVRNPAKVHKLQDIAVRNKLDVERFERTCKRLLKFWPLLK